VKKITDRVEIFDSNVGLLVYNTVSYRRKQLCNVSRANAGLLVHVCHRMSVPKFKHKMQYV